MFKFLFSFFINNTTEPYTENAPQSRSFLLACVVFALIVFFFKHWQKSQYTQRLSGFAIHGIDISHYQADINWETVARQDIHFAFIKATEGRDWSDPFFQQNWSAIKQVRMKRGAYHFFRPSLSAKWQAQNFISTVSLEDGDLPPVLDIEVADNVNDKAVTEGAKQWLEIVEKYYKVRPIIYTNLSCYNRFVANGLSNYPIWIARYNEEAPQLPNNKDWHFWQYGDKGRIDGINGDVDFNVFSGKYKDLERLCIIVPKVTSFSTPQ
jgi:lysozyme